MKEEKDLTSIWLQFSKTGDAQCFDLIYDGCKTHIYFIAYKYFRNKSESQDVVQDVFAQIIEKREEYGQVDNFIGWISTITFNLCKRKLAKIKRRKTEVREVKDWHIKDKAVANDAEGRMGSEQILEIISDLTPTYFTEILNYRIDGFTNPEIADLLGKTEKYVRDRKSLACKSLRETLTKHGYEFSKLKKNATLSPAIKV